MKTVSNTRPPFPLPSLDPCPRNALFPRDTTAEEELDDALTGPQGQFFRQVSLSDAGIEKDAQKLD